MALRIATEDMEKAGESTMNYNREGTKRGFLLGIKKPENWPPVVMGVIRSGKTTFSEQLLLQTQAIRTLLSSYNVNTLSVEKGTSEEPHASEENKYGIIWDKVLSLSFAINRRKLHGFR